MTRSVKDLIKFLKLWDLKYLFSSNTTGRHKYYEHVKTYKLAFSQDGTTWSFVKISGEDKVSNKGLFSFMKTRKLSHFQAKLSYWTFSRKFGGCISRYSVIFLWTCHWKREARIKRGKNEWLLRGSDRLTNIGKYQSLLERGWGWERHRNEQFSIFGACVWRQSNIINGNFVTDFLFFTFTDFWRQLWPLHTCRKHFGTWHQGKIREILSCDLQLRLYEGRGVRLWRMTALALRVNNSYQTALSFFTVLNILDILSNTKIKVYVFCTLVSCFNFSVRSVCDTLSTTLKTMQAPHTGAWKGCVPNTSEKTRIYLFSTLQRNRLQSSNSDFSFRVKKFIPTLWQSLSLCPKEGTRGSWRVKPILIAK